MNRRKRLVPCGGGGYIVVGDREKPAPCGGASCFIVGVRDVAVPTNRRKKLAPCGSVSGFVVGVREVAAPDGGGSFLRPASPGQAVARSLLLVVLDSPLARWRQFCRCMLECFLYHGSINQVSQDFSPPFPHVDPRRQQFVCHHSSSSVGLGIWMWAPSSSMFPTSSFHSSWRQPDGDYQFVKRAARQRRPKVAFVAALPQLPVDVHLLCCVVSS
uniref:DUF3778 domain-containing protein n=1 Tax=Oryza nivara TaxID=4536 RepID=A0A0E0FHR0_ORYNI